VKKSSMELNEKAFFDEVAPEWDNRNHHDPEKIMDILDTVGLKNGDSVLDVGCGTGVLVPYVLELIGTNGRIVGLDYSENMLRIAREKFPKESYPNVDFVFGGILTYEAYDKFDVVICYSSFPHFPDKAGSIKKMAKLLKPRGKLAICHSQGRNHINKMHKDMGGDMAKVELPSADIVSRFMAEANLNVQIAIDNDEKYVLVAVK